MRRVTVAAAAMLLVSACAETPDDGAPTDGLASIESPASTTEAEPPTTAVAEEEAQDDNAGETTMTDEEADESVRARYTIDVAASLLGVDRVDGPGTVELTVVYDVLENRFANAPTITIEISGEAHLGPMHDCEVTDRIATCQVADGLGPAGDPNPSTDFPVPVEITGTTGDVTITVIATSLENPVDNDPDPSNNTTRHTIAIG